MAKCTDTQQSMVKYSLTHTHTPVASELKRLGCDEVPPPAASSPCNPSNNPHLFGGPAGLRGVGEDLKGRAFLNAWPESMQMNQHGARRKTRADTTAGCWCFFFKSSLHDTIPPQQHGKNRKLNIPKVPCASTWTPTLRFVPPVDKLSETSNDCFPPAHWVGLRADTRNLLSNSLINSTVAALTSVPKTVSTCACRFASSADILAASDWPAFV